MLRTHFTEPEFFSPSSNLENREGQIIDFFFFSFFPKRFYQGFVLYISWKLHFQHMAWIVCNFYVPLAFRSASQRTRPSLSSKHQKHVQELEIYTESHTFSSPNAAVFSTSDKIALTSLSRFLFLSFFIFQLCYSYFHFIYSAIRIGSSMIYGTISALRVFFFFFIYSIA